MTHTSGNDPYRWVIVIAGGLGLFVCLGLGRFALGMMLPSMGGALSLTYSQMGTISTVNFCGYLLAVLLSGFFSTRLGPRKCIGLALLLVSITMISIGLASDFYIIALLYFITGIGSALANVPIMALVAVWFDKANRGRAAGLCVMGNGIGILLAGQLVPLLNNTQYGWRASWFVLGVISICITTICFFLIKDPSKTAEKRGAVKGFAAGLGLSKQRRNLFLHCGAIYFLFGFTYVIFVTFFVTVLVEQRGIPESQAGQIWSWVGILSLVSGPVFGYFSDRYGRKQVLAVVFFMQASAYLLTAMSLPMVSLYLATICFGVVAWSVPTIIAALIGDYTSPEQTASFFGFVTFLFGIGQILGPMAAGYLAEFSNSFSYSFMLTAGLAAFAVILCLLLPKGIKHTV